MIAHKYGRLSEEECGSIIEKIKELVFEDEANSKEKLIDINYICTKVEIAKDYYKGILFIDYD